MKLVFLLYFVLGTVVGSFLAVCIVRLPRGSSLLTPSCCDACGHLLHIRDLIPLVSFVLVGGRCRYCGSGLSRQIPAVELVTGLLFLFAGVCQSPGVRLCLTWCFLTGLVWETATDLRQTIIPDEAVLFLLLTGLGYGRFFYQDKLQLLCGALMGVCVLWLIRFVSRGGLGLGDIKLAGALGLWLGGPGMAVCLALAFLSGGIAGLGLWLFGQAERGTQIPFGPFLALGALISFFCGPSVLSWYWALFL